MHFRRSRFRRHRTRASGKLSPWAILAICAGVAVVLTLVIGNLLHLWLDDETLARLESNTSAQEPSKPAPVRNVPLIRAYPFLPGDSVSSLNGGENGIASLSLSLNTLDGDLLYRSDVTDFLQLPSSAKAELSEVLNEIYTGSGVGYISGVFYSQAQKQATADLAFAMAANEAALLREFIRCGGKEVVLLGLPFDDANIGNTMDYLRQVKAAIGSAPLGVAVPISVAASQRGWELLPSLGECSDFLLLDLQDDLDLPLSELMQTANYYLVSYQMRLLASSAQTDLINLCETTVSDFQIVVRASDEG